MNQKIVKEQARSARRQAQAAVLVGRRWYYGVTAQAIRRGRRRQQRR